ncbi:MAG: hypothetical protein IE916_00075 [Epsilonproteobacteria bacterium]|nr:hypothetical protein [Campylobacterota bacterium]
MLSMPTELLVALQENNITYSAALELNKIKDDEKRNALLKRCIDEGMSVSELSKEVKVINGKKPKDTDEVKTVFKQMEKRFKKLDQKKKKEFTKELNELMERY